MGTRRAPAWERIRATRPAIYYRNHHLRWSDTDMDDLRDSFSKLKKCVKRRLKGSKRKTDEQGAGEREERADASGSLPQPEAGVVTGGSREQGGRGSGVGNESVESDAAADENGSDWKSIVSSTAKSLLRGVRDSADAFPPLKSVAGGLCFILENYEV